LQWAGEPSYKSWKERQGQVAYENNAVKIEVLIFTAEHETKGAFNVKESGWQRMSGTKGIAGEKGSFPKRPTNKTIRPACIHNFNFNFKGNV
jgi:hypothetical protein